MKSKINERGLIEKREIIFDPKQIAFYKYFLLIVDKASLRHLSTYGPFDNPDQAHECAKLHGIPIG